MESYQDLGRLHRLPNRVPVERNRSAVEDQCSGNRDTQLVEVQFGRPACPWRGLGVVQAGRLEELLIGQTGVARGAGDAAPIGVTIVDGGLEQAAADNGSGDGPGV